MRDFMRGLAEWVYIVTAVCMHLAIIFLVGLTLAGA